MGIVRLHLLILKQKVYTADRVICILGLLSFGAEPSKIASQVHGAQCAVYQRTSTKGRHENARAPDIAGQC